MNDVLIQVIADGLIVPIVLLATYVLLFRLKHPEKRIHVYVRIVIAGLTALAIAKIVGHFWQPEGARPFMQLGVDPKAAYLDNAGFPSDHVLFAVAIFWAVFTQSKARWAAPTILVMALLVGLGRVLALVHTPLDVLGGIVFASIGAMWYLYPAYGKDRNTISSEKSKTTLE